MHNHACKYMHQWCTNHMLMLIAIMEASKPTNTPTTMPTTAPVASPSSDFSGVGVWVIVGNADCSGVVNNLVGVITATTVTKIASNYNI